MPNIKTKILTEQIVKYVKKTSQLYTDEWLSYNNVTKMYQHDFVNHGFSEYVQVKVLGLD